MTKKEKRHIIASVGTAVFMLLVFLLLWFSCLTAVMPEQEEGIEVAFGDVDDAGGWVSEQSNIKPMPTPGATTPVPPTAPTTDEYIHSDEEQALALQEEKKRKEEEERARREAEAVAKANAMGSLFNNTGTTAGTGDSEGVGQKGNPVGHGSSGGHNWDLAGRSLKGSLPQPSNNFKQEGRVVVQIRVNAAGQVISASLKGGDVSDKQTQQLALEAARKARFSEGDHDQIGTITYIFKLN